MEGTTSGYLFCLVFLCAFLWRKRRLSLGNVPGPPSRSIIHGNLHELVRGAVGEADFRWRAMYGDVVRVAGPLWQDVLLLSDPKAIQYSLNQFEKLPERRHFGMRFAGNSVVWRDGEDHKRQRRVMEAGFGTSEVRALVPLMFSVVSKLSSKLSEVLENAHAKDAVIDFPVWMTRATLDIIGVAGFGHDFECLDDAQSRLTEDYKSIMIDTYGAPSLKWIFMHSILGRIPNWLAAFIFRKYMLTQRLGEHSDAMEQFSREILCKVLKEVSDGSHQNHIMSRIVVANTQVGPSKQINEDDLVAAIRTLIIAGHETSAKSLTWIMYELCKHPDVQEKLRDEIRVKEAVMRERGDNAFTWVDLDNMPYAMAVIKEGLRIHPVAYHLARYVQKDDILPLATPVVLSTGEVVSELPIPCGTRIMVSSSAYNQHEAIFGKNPDIFNPDRWLGDNSRTSKADSTGIFGNMITFGTGHHSCIGYKFSVMETQVLLIELIKHFQFSLAVSSDMVRREACTVMVPVIEGEVGKGCQLPMKISLVTYNE